MDFHVLIVIACVFLGSLFSLLFINKFFRGKTFEEVAAEKKLLAEKLYGTSRTTKRQQRKVPNKKEIKKDKKQRQKESIAATAAATASIDSNEVDIDSHNDSDVHSVDSQSLENSPNNKKPHVEFSESEIIIEDDNNIRRTSLANEKSSGGNKTGKRKVSNTKPPGSGILVNKSDPVLIKETSAAAENLNTFDVKHPKDVVELKKQFRDDNVDNKKEKDKPSNKDGKKVNKIAKKEQKDTDKTSYSETQNSSVEEIPIIKDVVKKAMAEEKPNKSHDSPKNQNKQKKDKKKTEQSGSILAKLDGSDVIGVNCLMTLFNRAELNRSEIQMLIDYLLNKQQDTPANHSEWSDDIVQKLKKQLAEKDKALQEEQEASVGIQAKLRDLRAEINTERIQYNATIKAYTEEIQAKKMEIHNLTQEIQNLTEKMNLERQQFQAKLRHEKQAGSQELLAQIQQLNERNNILQNEIVQKNTFISELQMLVNASHQAVEETKAKTNEIIQQQVGQIHALEQNITEAEKTIARQQYDLELAKNSKVEVRNLQNALDSTKSEMNLSRNELNDSKQHIDVLLSKIEELNNQISTANNKCQEQIKESNELRNVLANYQARIAEKDDKLNEYEVSLKALTNKEDELLKQIREQKEKNNDLRTKNWKLVEALQNAETKAVKVDKKHFNNLVHQPMLDVLSSSSSSSKDEQSVRELFQRLFPEATKSTAGSALSLSFDQWIEQVVANHIKQYIQRNPQKEHISNNKLQQQQQQQENNSNNNSHNHQSSTQTKTNHNHHNNSEDNSNMNNSNENDSDSSSSKGDTQNLILQNAQLRAHIEELTAIVTRTENMLTNLETQAREQDAYWRSIVQSKQEEINSLKSANGQAI